jgi:MFS family permease
MATVAETEKKGVSPWFPSFATACLGGGLFGLDIGSSSSVVRVLGQGASEFGALGPIELGQVASASLLGAILSSLAITIVGDKDIGRKSELQIAACLFLTGTAVQSTASAYPILLLGRVLYGLGIGTAMHVAPLFIAETAPSEQRGRLISFKEAAIGTCNHIDIYIYI